MKRADPSTLSTQDLVARFVDIAVQQDRQLDRDDVAKFNKLYHQMAKIVQELKARPGDQRRALIALYDHPNIQVRMTAAVNSLALNYDAARRVLEAVAGSRHFPHAGDAGMTLDALDRGIFKPT